MAFYFSGHPNFAANQSVTVMEIITFESKAYKELDNKYNRKIHLYRL